MYVVRDRKDSSHVQAVKYEGGLDSTGKEGPVELTERWKEF